MTIPKHIAELHQFVVLDEIAGHYDNENVANLSVDEIAAAVSLSKEEVKIAIGKLVEQGHLAALIRVSGVHRLTGVVEGGLVKAGLSFEAGAERPKHSVKEGTR